MTLALNKQNDIKVNNSISMLKKYYLDDKRSFCVAFSGGKDSTAVLYLIIKMLEELKHDNMLPTKTVYIVNSNTLAELPPILKHLQKTLKQIEVYAKNNHLPLIVQEVFPELKNTLNVQLLGVGMPPPSSSLRWCTDKLKVMPIDTELKKIFPDGAFISIIGTRSDESADRAHRMERATLRGTNLKLNNRYPNASNLMPIEDWSTKDVWEYILKQNNDLVNIDFLWKLYSDASNKATSECTFAGAGGKNIEEGKLGCGTSRFGCWQCYMVRDKDKSLDGLMQSGHDNIEYYKEYRDWFWERTQQGWEKTRDVYSHNHQTQTFYNKGDKENPKYGMTVPRGLTLKLRKEAFKKILDLQSKLNEVIITELEIIEIQKRWIVEGDLNLTAFREARKYGHSIKHFNLPQEMKKNLNKAKLFYKERLSKNDIKKDFAALTLQRFAIQSVINPKKVEKKFFPSKIEETIIRKEWKIGKKSLNNNKTFHSLQMLSNMSN